MNIELSIIIPVYNVEEYLGQCIDSVLAQTYQDYEMILVNDGSTDNSGKICDEYAEKDPRIKVVHQQNKGLSGARNTGLDIMQGEYVYFIDSDDWLGDNSTLEVNMNIIRPLGSDSCVQIPYKKVFPDGKTLNYPYKISTDICAIEKDELWNKCFEYEIPNAAWARLYHKSIFKDLRFIPGILAEDTFILPDIIIRVKRYTISNYGMYCYLQREGSIMRDLSFKRVKDCYESYLYRMNYVSYAKTNKETYKLISFENAMIICFDSLLLHTDSLKHMKEIASDFRAWYNKINWREVGDKKTHLKGFIISHYWLLYIYTSVRRMFIK